MDKMKLDVAMMLPHQKPMLMVSEIVAYDDQCLTARAMIAEDNPLLENRLFPGHGALELLAQASGLFLGLHFAGEARPGAIVSIRDMKIHIPWLPAKESLMIETKFLGGNENAAMFQGQVMHHQSVVMEATLTVSIFPEGVMP
ncbi:MAG: hypothetical protein R8M38_02370 [Mariprofundaceae bacterium]